MFPFHCIHGLEQLHFTTSNAWHDYGTISGKKEACNIRVQIEPSDAVTTSGHSLLQTTLHTHTFCLHHARGYPAFSPLQHIQFNVFANKGCWYVGNNTRRNTKTTLHLYQFDHHHHHENQTIIIIIIAIVINIASIFITIFFLHQRKESYCPKVH